jgi:hypothetical protein
MAAAPAVSENTHFMVVPVAVVDDESVVQDFSVGSYPSAAGPGLGEDSAGWTIPRLVSTVHLVHVASGRLLGTRTCINPNQVRGASKACKVHEPVLLSR